MSFRLSGSTLRSTRDLEVCRRYQSFVTTAPYALLRSLGGNGDEKTGLEGIQCLVMDRKEARNALSVRMVSASLISFRAWSILMSRTGDARINRKSIVSIIVNPLPSSPCRSPDRLRARLLLLHSPHPKIFCAGADLRERVKMSSTQVSNFLDSLRSLFGEIEGLSIPTLAVVDGYALGGGTELALACDLRIAGK